MSNRGVPEWFGKDGDKSRARPPRGGQSSSATGVPIATIFAVVILMAGGAAGFLLMRPKPAPPPAATETLVAADPLPEPPTAPEPPPPPPDLVPAVPAEDVVAEPEEAADGAPGARSSADVRRGMVLLQKDLRSCYDNALTFAPDSEGTVLIRMTVAPSGSVQSARVTVTGALPPTVGPCVKKVAMAARFAAASDKTEVSLPVSFKKAD